MLSTFVLAISLVFSALNWLSFKDPAGEFTVKYPDNWEMTTQEEVHAVTFMSAQDTATDQFRENANVVVQDLSAQPTTLAEYTEATKNWVKESNGVIQLEREITFADNPSFEIAYTMPANAIGIDLELMFHQVWFIKNNKAYLLTYTAQPDSYRKYEEHAAGIFKSFALAIPGATLPAMLSGEEQMKKAEERKAKMK
jgi:hypothetical protein